MPLPAGIDAAAARERLHKEFNLEIGALAGKIWRIGLMGASARRENVGTCVKALDAVLG